MTGATTFALADVKNYEFELVEPTVKAGPDKTITVKLVDKTTGKAIPDAVIFATRLDMAPEGMQEMATKVMRKPGVEPGTYWFKASLGWPAGGSCHSAPRCRARPARSKTSSSSRPTSEPPV